MRCCLLLFCLTCLVEMAAAAGTPIAVLTSFSVLADLVRAVGGPRVRVAAVVEAGVDPHGHRISPADVRRAAAADLIVVNGLGFDDWMHRLAAASANRASLLVATEGMPITRRSEATDHTMDGDHPPAAGRARLQAQVQEQVQQMGGETGAHIDPHGWHDTRNARHYVNRIAARLCQIDASGCGVYQRRSAAYQASLDDLDRELTDLLSSVHDGRHALVLPHRALDYLTLRYGLFTLPLAGTSGARQASALQLSRLIRQIRAAGTAAVFPDAGSDQRMLRQIARETGARIASRLYVDTLSGLDGPASTYLEMMRHNARSIAQAFAAP